MGECEIESFLGFNFVVFAQHRQNQPQKKVLDAPTTRTNSRTHGFRGILACRIGGFRPDLRGQPPHTGLHGWTLSRCCARVNPLSRAELVCLRSYRAPPAARCPELGLGFRIG